MPRGVPNQPNFLRPREAFTGDYDGEPFVANPTEIFPDDHPIVKAHRDKFVPLEPTRQRPRVEQMTAAPGELRG